MDKYLMSLGTIIIFYTSIINLSPFKCKVKEIFLMITLAEISTCCLLYFGEFIAIIPMVVIPVIYTYKYSRNVVRSISIPLVSMIMGILSDNFLGIIFYKVFGIDSNAIRADFRLYWLVILIDLIFVFFISKALGALINKKIRISNLELRGRFGLLIIISLVLTLIIFYMNIILESKLGSGFERGIMNSILFLSYFILLIIIMYILISGITKEMDIKNKQIQFESLQEYTNNIEKLYTDMRGFRHDYVNILSSMIGYIEEKDMDSLERYFNEKIVPLSKGMESNNFKIGLLQNIRIPEIKGIFSSKLIRAQELGIDVFIDIVEPIERIDVDIIDLSRVMGITLDNAIEAAEKSDDPFMKVAIVKKDNSIIIIVINSTYENVPIYKIYQKGFSTKGENRGLGLYNLKEITGKYKNVSLDTSIENNEFKQVFQITNE